MFSDLINRLISPKPAALTDHDARQALGALLVRIARSDGNYEKDEQTQIDAILSHRYQLSPQQTLELRHEAELLEAEAPDTVRFTRAIKDAVAYEDRLGVIESLWKVVLADGKRTHEEDTLLRLVSNLLGVSDRDSALARQRVTP